MIKTFSKTIGNKRCDVKLRYDDECHNGHKTFAITGEVWEKTKNNRWDNICMGCCHDEIVKFFPEFAELIKWHLCGENEPMHYLSNTIYLAGDSDCWGKRKGEPKTWQTKLAFGDFPIKFSFKKGFMDKLQSVSKSELGDVIAIQHKEQTFSPKYTFSSYVCEWYECPFDTEAEALEFKNAWESYDVKFEKIATSFSNGKERELDAARNSAIWQEATDAELSVDSETLKQKLLDRLPALMADFHNTMKKFGLEE